MDQPRRSGSLWIAVLGGVCAFALGCLGLATAASVLSFVPSLRTATQGLAGVAFVGAFLSWGGALVAIAATGARGGRRPSWKEIVTHSEDDRQWLNALPGHVVTLVAVCMLVLLAGGLAGISDMTSGSPTEVNGSYFSNNHGDLTEMTRGEFERATAAETRLMAGMAGVFLSAAAIASGTRRNQLRYRSDTAPIA